MKVVFLLFAYWIFLANPASANSQNSNQNVPEVPVLTDSSVYTNTVVPTVDTTQTRDSNLPSVNQPVIKEVGSLAGNQQGGTSTNQGTATNTQDGSSNNPEIPVIASFISANTQTETSTNTETANTQSEASNQNEGAIRSFFANLAKKFRNLVNHFRGKAKENHKQAKVYEQGADAYQNLANNTKNSQTASWFQKLANWFRSKVAWFRGMASQNQKQAHLSDKKADVYERLSWSQELQMADCLTKLQKEILKRDTESLLKSGVSYNNITCPNISTYPHPVDSSIWDGSYPESEIPCQDSSGYIGRGIADYYGPPKINPSGQTLSEDEKAAKVKECLGKLAKERSKRRDNRSGWQLSCLHKKAHEVNQRQRSELRDKGYSHLRCSFLEDFIIAVTENDTVATAYQVGGCSGIKEGDIGLGMPYETVQCQKGSDFKMAICLDKLQKETHKKSKQELLMQGVAYHNIKCLKHTFHEASLTKLYGIPFSYINSCYNKSSLPEPVTVPLIGLLSISPEQKQAKLAECKTRLAATTEWLKQNSEAANKLIGSCIADKAAEIDHQQKEELTSAGASFQHCRAPKDYIFVTTDEVVRAYEVGGCSGRSIDLTYISRPLKTLECPLLAPLPVAENWDECVQQSMQSTVSTIKQTLQDQGVPTESITCQGLYGSDRGWKISCSSTEGGTATESDYQPYPTACGARPTRAVATSSSSGRQ